MNYLGILFIHLTFLICVSCLTQAEKEQQHQSDTLTYLKDSVIFDHTTYDFGTYNISGVDYIETTFQGKNIGQDSIRINCLGDIMTSPSFQWVSPKTSFSINAKYFVKGKREGALTQRFVAHISKSGYHDSTHKVIVKMKGYAITEEEKSI